MENQLSGLFFRRRGGFFFAEGIQENYPFCEKRLMMGLRPLDLWSSFFCPYPKNGEWR
jgi:hypothetical protein